MKILQANAGPLTNFEVLEFLRGRGAGKDQTRLLLSIKQSEFKVFDYLEQSQAGYETLDTIKEFLEKSKPYNLTKAEILNILNTRPSSVAEINPIIYDWDRRKLVLDDLVEVVVEVLPGPPPTENEGEDEGEDEDGMETEDKQ
ncbi:DNA-directed RNA polymerase III subunit RPC9-like isoform X2 [Impatiens glandulifera]|uniref:DNA-directed RNA polymerase III subunit RPC9-like isoform X2 n=1 Tax=Impatiens glandulifera TaxID=253017 RepID=UPI001FB06CDD|nr:DNA-directed RNA polymerase III subunit RPC9-like isoform X2 [Impatiens glandulifera]